MPDRVRVALIGAGRLGRRHAEVLASQIPQAELAAIADAHEPTARAAAEATRLDRWTTDPEELIADPSIDAVAIASSTDTHAPLIIAAAEAGKAIFCEKPIALDLEGTDAALDAVAEAGVYLQIGFQRRYDKGYRAAKERIDAGEIGRVETIRDAMRDPAPASREFLATSGGMFRDMTIHNFDAARWLAGSEVEEVYAIGAALVDPMFAELGDVDTSIVTLRFASGALGVIDNGRRSTFGYDVRTEIFGSDGALFVGQQRDTPLLQLNREGVRHDHVYWFLDLFAEAYAEELRVFVAAVADGTRPGPSGEDARAALALAYAAEASRRDNRPVAVSQFDRAPGSA